MQIDLAKLQRLEEAAKDANTLLTTAEDRFRSKRGELDRQKMILLTQWRSLPGHSRFALLVEEHGWSETRLTAAQDLNRFEHGASFLRSIREVEALQLELDRLAEDRRLKQERWQALAAPLPALREFAEKYGVRSGKPRAFVQAADRPAGPSIFGGAA